MRVFLLNIGNTTVQLAEHNSSQLHLLASYSTADLLSQENIFLKEFEDAGQNWRAVAASVVPELERKLSNKYAAEIEFISYKAYPAIDFSYYDAAKLGADRVANLAAAKALYPDKAVVVFDCGTCITSEAIDEKGVFCGGIISAGREMMLKSLTQNTAQLPKLLKDDQSLSSFAKNTAEAIRAGVNLATLGTVEKTIKDIKKNKNFVDPVFLVTGGDAEFFLENIPELEKTDPLFTLRGLEVAEFSLGQFGTVGQSGQKAWRTK